MGRRPGRLPGGELPDPLVRVERHVPGHDARLLARQHGCRRVRAEVHRLERPVPVGRPPPLRLDQLRHLPRRLYAPRPRLLRPQAQRGEPRGRPRRLGRQPVVELRRRGGDRRPGGERATGSPDAQRARHAAALTGDADAARRRRAPSHPAGEQQRVLPGQRAVVGRLGDRRPDARESSSSPSGSSGSAPSTRCSAGRPS